MASDPNASAAKVRAVWGIIAESLGDMPADARPVFSAWVKAQEEAGKLDLRLFRSVCEELREAKEANSYVTVTLQTIRHKYGQAMPAEETHAETLPSCGDCANSAFVFVVAAGDGYGELKLAERHQIAPYALVYRMLVPCRCDRGQAMRVRKKPGTGEPYRFIGWTAERLGRIWGRHVFTSGRDADRFVWQCVDARREAAEKAAGRQETVRPIVSDDFDRIRRILQQTALQEARA